MKTLKKKYSIAAFIDILGYKDLIQNESATREIEIFNELKDTIDFALASTVESTKTLLNFLDEKYESNEKVSKKLNVKQFSDNIYFSFDYEEENNDDLLFGIYVISNISLVYQRLMLGKGYFVRGGIAMGLNMVDKNFIFSTALIDAVEMEKDTIYPRITLHPKLKEKFLSIPENPITQMVKRLFVQDWSDHVFLNPFNHVSRNTEDLTKMTTEEIEEIENSFSRTQKRLINKINKNYSYLIDDKKYNSIARGNISKRIWKYKTKNQSIYEKYLWLRNFLNWVEKKPSELMFRYL